MERCANSLFSLVKDLEASHLASSRTGKRNLRPGQGGLGPADVAVGCRVGDDRLGPVQGLDRALALAVHPIRELDGINSATWPTSLPPTCYDQAVDNRTEPSTARQWIHYLVVAVIALFLVWWMLRVYVL